MDSLLLNHNFTHSPQPTGLSFGIDQILSMTCSTQLKKLNYINTVLPINTTKGRRRTVFTDYQLEQLKQAFAQSKYLIGNDRVDLASRLGLEAKSVKNWFQNHRIKDRRRNSIHSSTSDSD